MEGNITSLEAKEQAPAVRVEVLRKQFAAAAREKISKEREVRRLPDAPEVCTGAPNIPMEASGTFFPKGCKRGSKSRKAPKLDKLNAQIKEQARLADTAQALATSLQVLPIGANTPTTPECSPMMSETPGMTPNRTFQQSLLSLDLVLLHWDVLTRSPFQESVSGLSSTTPERTSALSLSKLALVPHNHLPINEVDKSPALNMFFVAYRIVPGSLGHFWFLQVGINYLDNQDAKTNMLLGLSTLMDILADAIDGFELHQDSFPGSAVLAFQYFLVWDKRTRVAQSPSAVSMPSPHRFNDEEDFKVPMAMWGVIQVKDNGNTKEGKQGSCLGYDWVRPAGAMERAPVSCVECAGTSNECSLSLRMGRY